MHPGRNRCGALLLALLFSVVLVACPADNDDAIEPDPAGTVGCAECVDCEQCFTCEECHTSQEVLLATVEPPEEPDGETEGAGEG